MSADLRFTTDSSSFFRQLLSSLAERNSAKTGHMLGSKCDLRMRVRNLGYLIPYKSGAKKPPFWWLRNLTANLTAYIFGMKRDVHKQSHALQTTRVFLHRLKTTWTLVHKRLQNEGEFSPTLVNSAYHFIARFHRRRSANWTEPNCAKRWTIGRANNLR